MAREFITVVLGCIVKEEKRELNLEINLTPDEVQHALSLWIPNTKDPTADSLCDFIHTLNPDYRAYSKRDQKLLDWINQTENITRC